MALECIGGAFLSSFLGVVFQKLASPQVLAFFCGTKLDRRLQKDMEQKLQSLHAVVDDAEQKQFGNTQVRDWLLKVKVAVLDVEDVLDEIQFEQLSRRQVEAESESQTGTGCTCKVPSFFESSSISSFNKAISSSMKTILDDLEDLANEMDNLGLKKGSNDAGVGPGMGGKVSQKSQSTSLVVESDICGRDFDKERIVEWLTSDTDDKLSILSIVGMGGLGKTTLTQLVYNDSRIEGTFDIKAWVCVSVEFDVFNVSRAILDTITNSTDHSRELEMVQRRLKEKLIDKKFLLVLDDVWNESRPKWEEVQKALVCGAHGCRILVTTRSTEVASAMRSEAHELKQLQEHDCWQLFCKHAFQDDDNLHQRDLDCTEIGVKIVQKCKGLPLALKTMGSLLHDKSSISEWESVLQSEIWEFSEEHSDILPALALSYHHLPPHLKTCFAYCGLFPKDHQFDKECLIQFWIAESLVKSNQSNKSPQEVGQQYFNYLISRSFFQQSSKNKNVFVMHDLLNDLAKYVCGEKGTQKITRHFSVPINHIQSFNGFETLCDTKRLRAFMPPIRSMNDLYYRWHCNMSLHELFSKFKFIHVLSLSHCSSLLENPIPDSLGNLKQLRSLDLSNTDIRKLPDSTCSLFNLQILKLNNCKYLKELPLNLHKLINLYRLEFIDTKMRKMPLHLGKLKNLQVLMSRFGVGKSSEFTIQQLGELNLHGRLSIGEVQNIEDPSDALAANLKSKTHLVQLELRWDENLNPDNSVRERDEIILENLHPSKHLEKLSIRNYGGKQFPNWLLHNSLSNMMSLVLDRCESCQFLPPLGLLPFLKNLNISGLDGIVSIDADFHGNSSSSFTSLETLEFSSMKAWEKWECQDVIGAFPCLQRLSIKECPKLKGHLPKQLLPLKTLEIIECHQLEAYAPMALDMQLWDYGKLQLDWATLKVLSIGGHGMEESLMEMIGYNISDTCLEDLDICEISDGYGSVKNFPLDFFPTLKTLTLRGFRNLQMISQNHAHNHLEVLRITACPQFESFPGSMHMLLPSLKQLYINDCPRIESFPEGGLPSTLLEMELNNCSKKFSSLKEA